MFPVNVFKYFIFIITNRGIDFIGMQTPTSPTRDTDYRGGKLRMFTGSNPLFYITVGHIRGYYLNSDITPWVFRTPFFSTALLVEKFPS